jgi:hypothetical protein
MGWLARDPNLGSLIGQYTDVVAAGDHPVWLIGNSTMGEALPQESLPEEWRRESAYLIHGSASLRSMSALLRYYIDCAPEVPERVILFNVPTHMNVNGKGPGNTTEDRYLELERTGKIPAQPLLMLPQVRRYIVGVIERKVAGLMGGKDARSNETDSGMTPQEHIYYRQIFAEFTPDLEAITQLGATAQSHGIREVILVMMPVAPELRNWFNDHVEGNRYREMIAGVGRSAGTAGLRFWDASELVAEREQFKDLYHVNHDGAREFQREFFRQWDGKTSPEEERFPPGIAGQDDNE